MSQMRLNPLNGRWVTIVAERAERPSDFASRTNIVGPELGRPCPFCPGNEEETPPALETIEADGSWSMRVIPNKYPAFDGDEGFAVHNLGPVHVQAEASGIHEVFVYSPDHESGLHHLDDEHAAEMMFTLRRRFSEHEALDQVRYTQAIVNHGREAGASIAHPHGQILGLPFVPGEIIDEERAFARFAGGCLLCTTVEAEIAADDRVVIATNDVAVITPFWSGVPYEMLIIPRHHEARRARPAQHRSRRCGVQSRLPHGSTRTWRRLSLARPRVAELGHPGWLRTRHRRADQRAPARAGVRDFEVHHHRRIARRHTVPLFSLLAGRA